MTPLDRLRHHFSPLRLGVVLIMLVGVGFSLADQSALAAIAFAAAVVLLLVGRQRGLRF